VVPWTVVYFLTLMLVQTLYTWVRLNILLQIQTAHVPGNCTVRHSRMHVTFAVGLVVTLLGLMFVIEFDHEPIPQNPADETGPIVWVTRYYSHYVGVVILVTSYFALHVPMAYIYVMHLYSCDDYALACETQAERGAAHAWPARILRGVYVGTEFVYAVLYLFFLGFWFLHINGGAVATEYILLLAFMVLEVLDGFLTFRLRYAYDL